MKNRKQGAAGRKIPRKTGENGGNPAAATVRLADFCENPENPQTVTDDNFARLVGKLRRVPEGLTAMRIAYVTDDPRFPGVGMVLSGNKRLRALREIYGEAGEVPAAWFQDVTRMSAAERHEFVIDANVNEGDWDLDALLAQYGEAELAELMGAEDLAEIMRDVEPQTAEGQTDGDAVPETPERPISKRGEVYQCGEHRLMCGDATSAEDVARLMGGEKADMCLTDPPYGVKRDKGFGGAEPFGGKGKAIHRRSYVDSWDSETPDKEAFDLLLANSKFAIIFGGNFFTDKLPVGGFWIVWDKHNSMPTFGDCELAWTNIPRQSVKKYDCLYNGLIGKEKERFHPTQKPIKVISDIISDFTETGETVLDLFGGSGTTLMACEQTNRRARLMELDPHYCDVIRRRWAEFVHGEGCDWERLTPKVDA